MKFDTVIHAGAVICSVAGFLALAVVVIAGLTGHTVWSGLTTAAILIIPAGFVFLLIGLLRAVARRRRA